VNTQETLLESVSTNIVVGWKGSEEDDGGKEVGVGGGGRPKKCGCHEASDVAIQLRFEPKGRGHEGNAYYLAPKKNECVACAAEINLLRYSVVSVCL